ncbi:6-phosphogluconolactonase/glucosamine-6-phosphate isomerase/deaminase [Alkalibacillus salilacus]|uniref:6-phosphogluconolactonase/glucosamine-6-phosphate isomerase/deaminase n=1 Tax=Alkalibacillus salilacus TaxID=284582 RepID=A0ABT9VFN8_9BACI|nr:6-phosphogluconolactonase/glucosamine-6-phosphate isomerase/deaminase [Alkalibacillus salilacus]
MKQQNQRMMQAIYNELQPIHKVDAKNVHHHFGDERLLWNHPCC